LYKGLARAQHRELIRCNGSRALATYVGAAIERNRCAAQQRAPTLLVIGGSLAQCEAHRGVLGDLLGKITIDACHIRKTLRREHARHAGFAASREQWHDVTPLAP